MQEQLLVQLHTVVREPGEVPQTLPSIRGEPGEIAPALPSIRVKREGVTREGEGPVPVPCEDDDEDDDEDDEDDEGETPKSAKRPRNDGADLVSAIP